MKPSDIAHARLSVHGLAGRLLGSPADVVARMGAVQSQDYPAARWALALRSPVDSEAAIDHLLDSGAILRTHVMRPTWHLVMPADIHWLLDLTSARLLASLEGRHRQLELDSPTRIRAVKVTERALQTNGPMTRLELAAALSAAGISTEGQRLPHMLLIAEVTGVVVNGPRRGKQFTFALLDQRVPVARRLSRDEALAELTLRYFRSHGPAQVTDFAWWSGLRMIDIREGLAGVGDKLTREAIGGREYWYDPSQVAGGGRRSAHLLPNFDEYTVGYRDRSALLPAGVEIDPKLFAYYRDASPQGGMLSNILLVDGLVRGSWRRTLTARTVRIDVRLSGPLDKSEAALVTDAATRMGRFLGLRADLAIDGQARLTTSPVRLSAQDQRNHK